MIETEWQQRCKICHEFKRSGNRMQGKNVYEKTEWSGYRNQNFVRHLVSRIVSPENRHPKLQTSVEHKRGFEQVLSIGINYCPWCGRKLGDDTTDHTE